MTTAENPSILRKAAPDLADPLLAAAGAERLAKFIRARNAWNMPTFAGAAF